MDRRRVSLISPRWSLILILFPLAASAQTRASRSTEFLRDFVARPDRQTFGKMLNEISEDPSDASLDAALQDFAADFLNDATARSDRNVSLAVELARTAERTNGSMDSRVLKLEALANPLVFARLGARREAVASIADEYHRRLSKARRENSLAFAIAGAKALSDERNDEKFAPTSAVAGIMSVSSVPTKNSLARFAAGRESADSADSRVAAALFIKPLRGDMTRASMSRVLGANAARLKDRVLLGLGSLLGFLGMISPAAAQYHASPMSDPSNPIFWSLWTNVTIPDDISGLTWAIVGGAALLGVIASQILYTIRSRRDELDPYTDDRLTWGIMGASAGVGAAFLAALLIAFAAQIVGTNDSVGAIAIGAITLLVLALALRAIVRWNSGAPGR